MAPTVRGKTTLLRHISDLDLKMELYICKTPIWADEAEGESTLSGVVVVLEVLDVPVEDYVLMGRLPYRNSFQFFESSQDMLFAKKYMKWTVVYHIERSWCRNLAVENAMAAIAPGINAGPELCSWMNHSHLDITHQVKVLNLIQRWTVRWITVLMIIHDLKFGSRDVIIWFWWRMEVYAHAPQTRILIMKLWQVYAQWYDRESASQRASRFLVSWIYFERSEESA